MRKRGSPLRWMLVLAVLVLLGALLKLPTVIDIGPGYTAELTCACLFVSGRSEESCKQDLNPLARKLVSVSIDASAHSVAGSWLGLLRRTAQYREGDGCGLVN